MFEKGKGQKKILSTVMVMVTVTSVISEGCESQEDLIRMIKYLNSTDIRKGRIVGRNERENNYFS